VKLKILAVITLMVFGCSVASAQIGGTFSFWDSSGDDNYCNYLVITYCSGGVVAGHDDLTEPEASGGCGQLQNSPIVGFVATTANDGQPAWGKGIVVGDALYDASADAYTGDQWTLWLSDKYNKLKNGRFLGPYGWMGVAGTNSGFYFGDNYGYLTASSPSEKGEVAGHGTIAGKLPNKLRR
jgi:hypothetical protein